MTALLHPARRLVAASLALLATCAALTGVPFARATQAGSNGSIIFSRQEDGNANLFVANADGSGVRALTTAPGYGNFPSSFAAGSKVAFVDFEHGAMVMNADGSARYTLPRVDPGLFFMASPDGTAFVSQTSVGNDAKVRVQNFDGSDSHVLLPDSGLGEWMARWSPDSKRIAFLRSEENNDLWVMNRDGSDAHLVASLVDRGGVGWSPDATQLIFSADTLDYTSEPPYVGTPHVYTVNADGSNKREIPLSLPVGSSAEPRFSPDGNKIAFAFYEREAAGIGLYTANVDGSGVQQITSGVDSSPIWLPVTAATPTPTSTTSTTTTTTTTSTTSTTVVANNAPKAVITLATSGRTLKGTGARSTDSDGTLVSYQWSWGDKTAGVTGRGVTHQYATKGSYRVALTVTDNRGAKNTTEVWVSVT